MTTPTIISPVSRHLSVADVARTTAFYRDVLGFDTRPVPKGDCVPAVAEAVYGPARDPDGHILWFAQSFQEPESQRLEPMFRKALPHLPLSDIAAGIAYYRDVLGCSINYAQHDLGVMDRDEITILLIARSERYTGIGSFSGYIGDADALHAELLGKGAMVQGEPVSRPWGLRDFSVLDLEGNQITFCQTFE